VSRETRDDSLLLASGKATPSSSDCKAKMSGVALNKAKAKARLSSEVKAKVPLGASATNALSEANIASLTKALLSSAKFAFSSRVKALSAKLALSCEARSSGKTILASLMTKKKAFKAKLKAFKPKRANFQSLRVFVSDWLGPINTNLRDYLRNK